MSIAKDHFLVAMDVVALYPSIRIDLAFKAVEVALVRHSKFFGSVIEIILDLIGFSLRNSLFCYKGDWFKSVEGVPTGGPESPPLANILVNYVLDEKMHQNPVLKSLNKLVGVLKVFFEG